VIAIFLALTFQFKNAIKPFIVFAAVPFGSIGALLALWIMGSPFGFMGFLGVISLVGVIVSHIIVLFDFIEEKHAEGEPFEQAVLDAGIGATVFGLFPLAAHGGPLWEPSAMRRSDVDYERLSAWSVRYRYNGAGKTENSGHRGSHANSDYQLS
jgi:hypothetical protein